MQATIKEKREVAKGTLMVTFDLLGEEVDFLPGQYFWVELLNPPHDDEKGARPLRRAIQHYIEDPLADFVLGRSLKPGSTIMIGRKDEEEVDISVIEGPEPEEPEKVTVPPEEPVDSADDEPAEPTE